MTRKKRVTTPENYQKTLERKSNNRKRDTIYLRAKIEAKLKELENSKQEVDNFLVRLDSTLAIKEKEKNILSGSILILKELLSKSEIKE